MRDVDREMKSNHLLNTGGREVDINSENPHILCHSWIFFKFLQEQTILQIEKLQQKKRTQNHQNLSLSRCIAKKTEAWLTCSPVKYAKNDYLRAGYGDLQQGYWVYIDRKRK
jgi:hypothetical protein